MVMIQDKIVQGLKRKQQPSGDVWVLVAKQRIVNKTITITYGKVNNLKLSDVRNLAKQDLALLAQGINPKDKQLASKQAGKTLADAFEEYKKLRSIKPNTINSYSGTLRRNVPDWMGKPLRAISHQMIVERYSKIIKDIDFRARQRVKANPRGESEAQKTMRTLTAIFSSFEHDRLPDGSLLLPNGNPIKILKSKGVRASVKPRTRYLGLQERITLRDELANTSHPEWKGFPTPQQAGFVMFLLLTGLRLNEARTLKWADVDFELGTFTIEFTKNGRQHTLPITNSLSRILKTQNNETQWVFPSKIDASKAESMSKVFSHVEKLTGIDFTPHDLRRTTATMLAESGFSTDSIGALLNHSKRNQTAEYIQTTLDITRPLLEGAEYSLFNFDMPPENQNNYSSDSEEIEEI